MPEAKKSMSTTFVAADGHARTMEAIFTKMDQLGDLPIFSASVNHIRRVSSDPSSDAMELAQVVMRDANLSAKLLRLSNSAYYNRGAGKISAISRTVVLLGFKTIKSLCLTLKLLESFQHQHESTALSKLLVRSYLSAGFVRELSLRGGVKDVEESYICALLHRLGEIAVSYFLPEQYECILEAARSGEAQGAAELSTLGTTFSAVGQGLASSWEFPNSVVGTLNEYNGKMDKVVRHQAQFNAAMASLSNKLVDSLYHEDRTSVEEFDQLMRNISKCAGIDASVVETCLGESFRMSCDLAETYGINKRLLRPPLGTSDETGRDKWARRLAYLAADAKSIEAPLPPPQEEDFSLVIPKSTQALASAAGREGNGPPPAGPRDAMFQLQVLQDITMLISSSARMSEVFLKVLEGIHLGAGFDRAALCLVSSDRRHCIGRLTRGRQTEELKRVLTFRLHSDGDLLSQMVVEGRELLVEDPRGGAWYSSLPVPLSSGAPRGFVIAGLTFKNKPVGLLYADKAVGGEPITSEDYRSFLQFVAQARLALRLCQ